ncbi:MAG: DNA repair protein RecO [Lactobacillales bacterium]|jgi:DNA repair protein RecO (recombination protein O)|nr:DNA repair protein RecO [Lactobacillales bacterium]
MSQNIEFQGMILFSKDYKEKDRLVKIFTEQAGKRMFFVRNIKKRNNPLVQGIMNFCYGLYIGKLQKEGLSFLNGVKIAEMFSKIQSDIFLSGYATYILNLVDIAIEDNEYDPSLYVFTNKSLQLIDRGYDAEVVTIIFELQILSRFGIQLAFDSCAVCGKEKGKFDFSSRASGIVCDKHYKSDLNLYQASPRAVYFVRMLSNISLDNIGEIKLSVQTKRDIRKLVDAFYEEYVGICLKSKKFIDQMYKWEK